MLWWLGPWFWGYIMANFHKLCSITLTSVTHTDFCVKDACHWPHSVERWWGSDEGNQLFIWIIHTSYLAIPAKRYGTWLTHLFLWSLPIVLNEALQTVTVKAKLFLTSKLPKGVSQGVQLCSVAFQQVNRNLVPKIARYSIHNKSQKSFLNENKHM